MDSAAKVIRSSGGDGDGCKKGSRWSQWVDRDNPGTVHAGKTVNGEHEFLTPTELEYFCPDGHVVSAECSSEQGASRQNSSCNTETGLICRNEDNAPSGCKNSRIRYFCKCQDKKVRFPRAVASLPRPCNNWTMWINHHHPNDSATGHDAENTTRADLESHCPLYRGATITDHQCKDEKGEPFKGFKKLPEFNVTCERSGYVCTPVPGKLCADIQINYFCHCPAKLSQETTVPTTVTTSTTTTTVSINGRPSAQLEWPTSDEDVTIFGKTVSVCVLIVIICAILTLCHCGVTIWAFRSLSRKIGDKKMTSVYPFDEKW